MLLQLQQLRSAAEAFLSCHYQHNEWTEGFEALIHMFIHSSNENRHFYSDLIQKNLSLMQTFHNYAFAEQLCYRYIYFPVSLVLPFCPSHFFFQMWCYVFVHLVFNQTLLHIHTHSCCPFTPGALHCSWSHIYWPSNRCLPAGAAWEPPGKQEGLETRSFTFMVTFSLCLRNCRK